MPEKPHTVPKIAIQGIAGGLLLMAFFTMIWAALAAGGLNGIAHYAILVIFAAISGAFVANALHLFKAARHFPPPTAEHKAEGKNFGMWYGIIFGAEGIIIPLVVFVLLYFQQDKLILPAIALVVGLHFYPMALVFKRTIDYYLATWTCLIAIAAIIITLNGSMAQNGVFAFLGIGVALATSGYGFYMIYEGKRLTKLNATFLQ